MDRNSTNFPSDIYKYISSLPKTSKVKYHQMIIAEIMKMPNTRGMLIYNEMGTGKTITGANACRELLSLGFKNIKFIAAKSLHDNFRKEYRKYLGLVFGREATEDEFQADLNKFTFISLNASNMFEQVKRKKGSEFDLMLDEDTKYFANLDDCVVVWDEFHNFLNSVANGSKNAMATYDSISKSKHIKLIGLTGTPIMNDPYEIALGFNLMSGYIRGDALFGEDYFDFTKFFVRRNPDDTYNMINKDKFQDRILGLVSYYGADSKEIKDLFPIDYQTIIQAVPMSTDQYVKYAAAREKEIEETKRGFTEVKKVRLKKPSGSSSTYRVHSRQYSNILYPDYAIVPYTKDGVQKTKKDTSLIKASFFTREHLAIASPKILAMLHNVAMHLPPKMLKEFKPSAEKLAKIIADRTAQNAKALQDLGLKTYEIGIGPGIIYSQFIDSGLETIARCLEAFGMTRLSSAADIDAWSGTGGSFVLFTGDTAIDDRPIFVKEYNSKKNMDGSVISLMLISATGAEGLDLKHGRHAHAFEPFWNYTRINQVFRRISRAYSHIDMPMTQRSVQSYIYLSNYPKGKPKNEITELTTDYSLFYKAIQNQRLIDEFLQAIKEASVDCMIHYNNDNIRCRMCTPTGKILWTPDFIKDITQPSPCQQESITAKEVSVKIGKTVHKYYINGSRLFKKSGERFIEIKINSPEYHLVFNSIKP